MIIIVTIPFKCYPIITLFYYDVMYSFWVIPQWYHQQIRVVYGNKCASVVYEISYAIIVKVEGRLTLSLSWTVPDDVNDKLSHPVFIFLAQNFRNLNSFENNHFDYFHSYLILNSRQNIFLILYEISLWQSTTMAMLISVHCCRLYRKKTKQ